MKYIKLLTNIAKQNTILPLVKNYGKISNSINTSRSRQEFKVEFTDYI